MMWDDEDETKGGEWRACKVALGYYGPELTSEGGLSVSGERGLSAVIILRSGIKSHVDCWGPWARRSRMLRDFVTLLRTVCDLKFMNCLFLEFSNIFRLQLTSGNRPWKAEPQMRAVYCIPITIVNGPCSCLPGQQPSVLILHQPCPHLTSSSSNGLFSSHQPTNLPTNLLSIKKLLDSTLSPFFASFSNGHSQNNYDTYCIYPSLISESTSVRLLSHYHPREASLSPVTLMLSNLVATSSPHSTPLKISTWHSSLLLLETLFSSGLTMGLSLGSLLSSLPILTQPPFLALYHLLNLQLLEHMVFFSSYSPSLADLKNI